jgi:KEOPS complex subunit Cgi121
MITVIGSVGTIQNIETFVQQLLLFSKNEHLVIQAFDASAVFGETHLVSATQHALRAFEQKTNATNSLALEILLYAAGERQINKAIKKIGIKKGRHTIAFVLIDQRKEKPDQKHIQTVIRKLLRKFHLTLDNTVLEGDRDTLKKLGITDQEIVTIPESKYGDLVLEKVALVDVIK